MQTSEASGSGNASVYLHTISGSWACARTSDAPIAFLTARAVGAVLLTSASVLTGVTSEAREAYTEPSLGGTLAMVATRAYRATQT